MMVFGIDPGVSGAIAIHNRGELVHLADMPNFGGRTDPVGLIDLIRSWGEQYGGRIAFYLEDTHAMPRNGSIASYSLGLNTGIVIGVIGSLQHPLIRVRPTIWKTKMGVTRRTKDEIRGIARELYPSWASSFARVKDHNRAEAVLISRYGVAAQLQEVNS